MYLGLLRIEYCDMYFDPVYIIVYYVSLDKQKKEVFENISYMKIGTGILK